MMQTGGKRVNRGSNVRPENGEKKRSATKNGQRDAISSGKKRKRSKCTPQILTIKGERGGNPRRSSPRKWAKK